MPKETIKEMKTPPRKAIWFTAKVTPKVRKPIRKVRGKALWATAFPKQHKAIHPERSKAGGVKARSHSEEVRNTVYLPIRELHLTRFPVCEVCQACIASDVHHRAGRSGLLLFDVRYFTSICRPCHRTIHHDEAKAKKEGWILDL